MKFHSIFLAGLVLCLGACANVRPHCPTAPNVVHEPNSSAVSKLNEISRVAALTPEQRRRELAELDSERQLNDARRFQLAALLERDGGPEALERSLKILVGLDDRDNASQQLVEQLKKSLRARIELRQQTSRAKELQDMLDQIKALEKSLQQRNATPDTP